MTKANQKKLNRCCTSGLITGSAVAMILASQLAIAQSSGGDFEITRHTIDNGGGSSSGGDFELNGTIGQPDASLQTASGGDFQLTGGFWANGVVTPLGELLFSDGFESL